MKYFFSLITLLVFSFSGLAQDKIYVKFETEIIADGEEAEMMKMMMNGSTMEIATSKERTWVKTEVGTMITMTMEVDSKTEEMTMLMSGMVGDMAFQGDISEMEPEEEPEVNFNSDYTETKEILGYTCKKATVTDEDGNVVTYWYTDKLLRPDGVTQMPDQVPGMCLEFEAKMQEGITMKYTAIEANDNVNMSEYKIAIPEGVDVMSLSDLKNMGMIGN